MKYTTLTVTVLVIAFLIGGLPLLISSTSAPGVVSEDAAPVPVTPSVVESHVTPPAAAPAAVHTESKSVTTPPPKAVAEPTPAPAPTPAPQQTTTPPPAAVVPVAPVTPAAKLSVDITNFTFSPWKISVKKGTTVTWTNQDNAPHTVTSNTDVFGSDSMGKGATYSYTFNTVGTFPYYCAFHTSMVGTVAVTE